MYNFCVAVMVPVSSTVIPLPVYKMEYGFGFISKDKKAQSAFKPSGSIKLITGKDTGWLGRMERNANAVVPEDLSSLFERTDILINQ